MNKIFFPLIIVFLSIAHTSYASDDNSTKAERNLIREGNEIYNDSNYHAALENYEKAIALNAASQYALYNKAVTLTELVSDNNKGTPNDPRVQADSIFEQITDYNSNHLLSEYASYNRGNMAFNDQNYGHAIEMYKDALRINPENRKARQNLLLAIKKQEEQEQNPDKQDQQEQQQEEQQQQQQQAEPQQMSQNAEQILQSVQNKENATRRREQKPSGQRYTDKPW